MCKDLNILVKKPDKNKDDNMDKKPKIANVEKKQIEDLLKSSLQDFLLRKSTIGSEKAKNVQNLVSLITEYLSAFIVIGYDVSGEPVNLIHATNQMDADALSAAINKFIIHSIQNNDK